MARIISISFNLKRNTRPLTAGMIRTLQDAYRKQSEKKLFGPADIGGSFLTLFKRDLIGCRNMILEGKEMIYWFVTEAGIKELAKTNTGDHFYKRQLKRKNADNEIDH